MNDFDKPSRLPSQTVNLGCGTLILIALIVMFFSGRGNDLEKEIKALRSDVQALKTEVSGLKAVIEAREKPARAALDNRGLTSPDEPRK